MGIFEFILGIIALIVGAFITILYIAVIFAEKEAIKENEVLREELIKLRKQILKREYKKNKIESEDK